MRKVLLALALLGLAAGSASATPENLSNGVFIAHYAPSLVYTTDTPAGGWGEALQTSEDAIDECGDQNLRIEGISDHQMWFIVSAWDEDKVWCSTQMGIVGYDPAAYLFQDNGPVYPGGGTGLEIYTNVFPHGDPVGGPSGVICGPEGGNWGPANFEPVWWFEGYAYAGAATVVQLGVDPSTAFGGWFNCENPPGEFAAMEFGGMGVNTDGVPACPGVVEYLACCFPDGSCELLTEDACAAAGGFLPGWDYCEPNDCPPPPPEAVCCFEDGTCVVATEEICGMADGDWRPDLGDSCEPNPCPQPRAACCFEVPDGACEVLTEMDCLEAGGDWYPEWTCEPNNCPVATDAPSWGSIKAMYR